MEMGSEETGALLFNDCHGGLRFSEAATRRYHAILGTEPSAHDLRYGLVVKDRRSDPVAIAVVKELGQDASGGKNSKLNIAYFPKRFENMIKIDEYDGKETVYIDVKAHFLTTVEVLIKRSEFYNDAETVADLRQALEDRDADVAFSRTALTYEWEPMD